MRGKPHAQNIRIGQTLRACRKQAGLTQAELAKHIGVSPQQLQKYEKGRNFISAARLATLAEALDIPIPALLGMQAVHSLPDAELTRLYYYWNRIRSSTLRTLLCHAAEIYAKEGRP